MTTGQMNASTPDNVNFIRKIEQICFFLYVLFRDRICKIIHKSATTRLYIIQHVLLGATQRAYVVTTSNQVGNEENKNKQLCCRR